MIDYSRLEEIEKFFELPHDEAFKIADGSLEVMLSAPHSVTQTRKGVIKKSEKKTGVLALLLNEDTGCPSIVKTKNCGDDANFDAVSDYKHELIDYVLNNGVKLLIDLHELAPSRKVLIDMGTGKLKNVKDTAIINRFLKAFGSRGMCVQIDAPFSASNPNTVSSSVARYCNIPCVQLEINSRLLYPQFAEYDFNGVYSALKEIITRI